ncbi:MULTISPECIES: genetic competence negative regulator [Bacillus]|uniref:Adapter protein MecA n=1 Tax=Bacillus pseudomycoides TaxID=64104 RepID=A0AAJ2DN60_9BACI|nr:genetic competence negative regulator [Bacillus pseudomycoides]EEM11929.1 Adapter protein mecA 2 [Bacillus pseudomycoides]KFN15621.1 negative regulator of genetic competence family protein [Bacillus pseudomycoides]MBD5796567.1 adaptor protein [Bacillus pseudomycoides]MCR8856323.1 genetic competence negative regulator [Bacillus pseudomycoides]MDR4186089.1 genetic competence negative regulator [Bacillus pseudomycoides]
MRLERLNYNKIKIFLTFDDLSERGLTKEDLWKNAPKVQQLFRDMMQEANKELGFEADGPIAVEVFSLQAQGMVVIVTKENHETDTEDEFRDEFIEMQVTLDESEHILYEFATFEDVITLANRLYNLGVTGGKLYTWDGRFYLWMEEETPLLKEDIIAILAEYGNSSTATIYRIMEYGKELMDSQAIQQIYKYFVLKQNLS